MARGRQLRRAYLLGSLLVLAASLHPTTAYSAPGDPPSGSPAGAVYQLPLEQGRADAAPKGGGGGGAIDGDTGGSGAVAEPSQPGSLYRSENNFGSSSEVPGVAAAAGTGGGGGGAGGGGPGAAGAAIAGGAVAAQTGEDGNTSIAAGIVLLGAIALLAVAVAVLSRRARINRAS